MESFLECCRKYLLLSDSSVKTCNSFASNQLNPKEDSKDRVNTSLVEVLNVFDSLSEIVAELSSLGDSLVFDFSQSSRLSHVVDVISLITQKIQHDFAYKSSILQEFIRYPHPDREQFFTLLSIWAIRPSASSATMHSLLEVLSSHNLVSSRKI
ncbi:hypothetical protein RCL1_004740 [Eukaryota sp. TZLM3-RCL]